MSSFFLKQDKIASHPAVWCGLIGCLCLVISGSIVLTSSVMLLFVILVCGFFWALCYMHPELALAIQSCGFYILLFGMYVVGINTNPIITMVFHIGLASCYLLSLLANRWGESITIDHSTFVFLLFTFWIMFNWGIFSRGSEFGSTKLGLMLIIMVPAYFGGRLLTKKQLPKLQDYLILLGVVGIILAFCSLFAFGSSVYAIGGRFRISPNANPLIFAYPMGVSLIFIFGLAIKKGVVFRLFALMIILSGTFFMIATGSRGPILALIAALLTILFLLGSKTWITAIPSVLILTTIAYLIVLPILPESVVERQSQIFELFAFNSANSIIDVDDISTGRISLWMASVNVWLRNPVTGIGIGNFKAYSGLDNEYAHNVILELLSETGLIGLILFTMVFLDSCKSIFKLAREHVLNIFAVNMIGLWVYGFVYISLSGQFVSAILYWFATGCIKMLANNVEDAQSEIQEAMICTKSKMKITAF